MLTKWCHCCWMSVKYKKGRKKQTHTNIYVYYLKGGLLTALPPVHFPYQNIWHVSFHFLTPVPLLIENYLLQFYVLPFCNKKIKNVFQKKTSITFPSNLEMVCCKTIFLKPTMGGYSSMVGQKVLYGEPKSMRNLDGTMMSIRWRHVAAHRQYFCWHLHSRWPFSRKFGCRSG